MQCRGDEWLTDLGDNLLDIEVGEQLGEMIDNWREAEESRSAANVL